MPTLSQEEARDFIAEVREDNGGITAEDRDFLNANRPSALRALQKTRRQLADSIKILVDNLYSKETRFLYELIQNAEDNSYSTAAAAGEEPFLAFKVYPDRIIIDSNEDGFSKDNIKAICSVGNSTKKQSAGYIGEKGIGFKSVFKVAQKVHIQSAPFSFAFSHTREDDDDGLGMITPYYEDAEELPLGVRTRMTLTLLDSTKNEERASEFRDVPDTFLMFLSRLQRLSIELYQPDNAHTATRYSKRETKENGLYTTFLAKSTHEKGKEESSAEQKYYTMKSDLYDLPFDEARKDKQGNSIDRATVILAFPVDEHDEPVLKQQYTYAFLPLRRVGFKFLIQADFVTQANREDVVHSKRNQAVLKGVAKAFADAVVVLNKRPSLRYQWMRYLPKDFITHEFWRTLWTLVREKLEQTPLLEPWSGNGLYKPSDLEKLLERFIAEDRTPLLPDLKDAEVYLSPKYTEADFQILKRLGTTSLQWSKFVDRLEADLRIPVSSRWRSWRNIADWRYRICKQLSEVFIENLPHQQKRLRMLALIPLHDGKWVSSASGTTIYFPKTHGIPIPEDLGLDLVCPIATENVAWADLLSTLGVMSCTQDYVISSIHKRYNATNLDNFKVSNAVAHIRYLYWFLPKDHSSLPSQVRLANQHGSLLKKDQYLYFPDEEDDYSPSRLFKQDAQLPGYPVHYLHEEYLKAVGPEIIHHGRPWMSWLEEIVAVRRRPELCAKDHKGLSKEFQYIVNHRSNRLLGTLKRGWAYYRPQIDDFVEEGLRNSAVLLENGRRIPLLRTFLPLPKLTQIVAELRIADAYPFIAVSELLRDEGRSEWMFLKDLHVGVEENLDFYLSALEAFKTINPAPNYTYAKDQLIRIYQNIQSRCSEGLSRVRDIFSHPVIWIQPSNRIDSSWISVADCVWDGPQWLESKQRLKFEDYVELEILFKLFLKTPDASQIDVLNDLLMLKSAGRDWKSHGGDRNVLRSQSTTYTQPKIGTAGAQYQVTSGMDDAGTINHFQSITFMKAYEKQSFEELRLEDYYSAGRKPLSTKTSVYKSKAFAGLEDDKIIEEAEKRYEYLSQKHSFPMDAENLESRKALLFTFEYSAFVYVPKENAWFPPSQCVWVDSSVKIPGKASIADVYPLREIFFTTVLKISKPTVMMYIDSLIAQGKGKTSAAQIKETMALICSLGVGENDFSSLIDAKVLPVKLANGARSFASASSKDDFVNFAIMENTIHWDAFESKIEVLEFSLEEIRDTRPLLLALGLEERFSSKLVKEVTDVKGGSQDHEMTRILRIKSQAIVRCAVHYADPSKRQDVASLYRKFKRAVVYVSDDITHSLQITQEALSIESATSRANFHFEEAEGALRLYLPKDNDERDVCFESDLPRRLCTFLGITDPGASGVLGGVFRIKNPVVMDRILEKAGVSPVDCDFAALDKELGASEAESDIETLVEATSDIRHSTPSSDPRRYKRSAEATWIDGRFGSESIEDVRDATTPSPSNQERHREAQETAYKRILEHVVNVARQRVRSGIFESSGVSIEGPMATEALPPEIFREAFATRTQERDFKIGAAGELYMFEYLMGLGLPRFGLENWKSEIRDRVKIHAGYQDLEKDNGRSVRGAVADIEYLDDSGGLTQYLIQTGHLAQELWNSERPLYHIEIKTTTSSNWQEPFFMSKAQQRHIQDKRIEDGKSCSSIYVICRLFNLGKGDETGMHVYLDPETKRRNQELDFSTHTWAVKPLAHPTMLVENGIARASAARTTMIVPTAAGISGDDTRINDTNKDFVVPSVAKFGSSATNSVPRRSDLKSALGSQKTTESPSGSLFASNSAPLSNNSSTQPPSRSSLLGTTKSSSTGGIFSSSNGVSPSNDTSRPPSFGLFGSNATSSNSGGSKSKGGLFDFNTVSANDHPWKAISTGNLFNTTANSDASKGTSPSTTVFSGFGTSSNTPSKALSANGLFSIPDGSPSSNGSRAPSASSPSGTKNVSSNSGTLKSMSSTYSLGTPESLSSATTGGLFRTNPSPSNAQIPEITATDTSPAAVQPTSSTTIGSIFGTAAPSGPSQSATGFSGFGTSSSMPTSAFGTNATTSTSFDAFKFTQPKPPASNLFGASGETSTSAAVGSISNTGIASTSKPTRSNVPSVLTFADLAPTENPFTNLSQGLNQDSRPRRPKR